jgi:RHS repeat-associated protein
VLKDGMRFFVYTDHLNTPRAIADTTSKVVWRWEGDPFGQTLPDEDPDRDGTTFTYNLRFPGQQFDPETGLAYNYFRDYDPQTGRYIQADPIGLKGGVNPYRYAEGNPVTNYDPKGLADGNVHYFMPDLVITAQKPSHDDGMGMVRDVMGLTFEKYGVVLEKFAEGSAEAVGKLAQERRSKFNPAV